MPELNLYHIDQITRDINREEISFSHLLEDLIDHICCDVEYEMQKGSDFSEAYKIVKQKIGPHRLKEIQKETLYLVDTKYRNMKNLMKISGIAGTILFGFAAMFKIQHWPLAGVLMTLGALTLIFAFLPSALSVLWKETHNTKRLLLFISAFLSGACFVAGTLFKIQHWPFAGSLLTLGALLGILFFIPSLMLNRLYDPENKSKRGAYILGAAGTMLYVAGLLFKIQHWPMATLFMVTGMILLVILALPLYTWISWKEENHISPIFIFLITGSLLIIIPGTVINLNMQHSYQGYYYPNNYQQSDLYKYLFSNNISLVNRYRDSLSYPKMEQLHSKTAGIIAIIDNIQEKMIQESEGEPGKPAVSASQIKATQTGHEIVYTQLSKPLDRIPVKTFLLSDSDVRKELNTSMGEYLSYLEGMTPAEDLLKYKKMLDTETFLPVGKPDEGKVSLMSGLHSLEIMKNGLLTVESCVLNKLIIR
jgi:hypothetical protein